MTVILGLKTGVEMKISFIGYGNMARAMAKSLIHNPQYQLFAAAPSLPIGVDADGVHTSNDNAEVVQDADVIILAVKPMNMLKALEPIKQSIPKNSLILSVATGLSLSWLAKHCPEGQAIVRSMPNIAISVLHGATPLIANEFVTAKQKSNAEHLFERSGIITWIENERDMDVFTALSGSGPAYVFYFLEGISKAAEKLGMDYKTAKQFSIQTVLGAVELAQQSGLEFSELRQKVTSPAGTTAAAIQQMKDHDFELILFKAVEAAYNRAGELGLG